LPFLTFLLSSLSISTYYKGEMLPKRKRIYSIFYIQAKRWADNNAVGRPEIQKFVGALAGQGAKKGIFITTSYFTQEALEYAPRNEIKIVLIDGEELSQLMIDYNLGVSTQKIYEIKRIDHDYFGDE